MEFVVNICRNNPQIILFLALAVGYALGKVKFFGISLGATTCTLLAALVLGQINVDVSPLLKTVCFALFMFAIGYRVGPQFFGALRKGGLDYLWISLVVCFSGLAFAILLGKMMDFDQGTTAGMFAGSMTQSAAIGTAEDAIAQLPISDAQKSVLDSNVAVGYAITYIFGTAGTIVFLKMIPGMLRINLKQEAARLEEQMSGGAAAAEKPELFSWSKQLELRAYRATASGVAGRTVSQIEALFSDRVCLTRIKRGNNPVTVEPDTIVKANDTVVLSGGSRSMLSAPDLIGPEIDMTSVMDVVGEVLEVCVLNKAVVGRTLGELSKNKLAHGIFLSKVTRQGHEIPITRDTEVHKCDVFSLIGVREDIERVVGYLGYPERPTNITDLVMLGLGIVLGTLLGLVVIHVGKLPITLGVGGGVLVSGLVFGWLRSVHPTFGQIQGGAQWLLSDLGLNLFIACVGVSAAVQAVQAFETTGLSVFLAGAVLSLVPIILGLIVGRYLLKMNIVLLMGAVCGARVITAALNTLQEDADSTTPALGFAVPYAVSNVILTVWGSVIISVMT
ncbi:MAG: aspartate-alanine antiporter [Dehalococcoidia bacterium]|nr:aspartate-alanine antiporter [Dehalococcoidia bacterium]